MAEFIYRVNTVADKSNPSGNPFEGELDGLINGGSAKYSYRSGAFDSPNDRQILLGQLYFWGNDWDNGVNNLNYIGKINSFNLSWQCKANSNLAKNHFKTGYNAKVDGGRYVNPPGGDLIVQKINQQIPDSNNYITQSISLGTDWTTKELRAGISFRLATYVTNTPLVTIEVDYANFKAVLNYTLKQFTVSVVANEGGTVSGSGTYDAGSTINISANPLNGYKFIKWNDGNTNPSRNIIVTSNITYTATFEPIYTGVNIKKNNIYIPTKKIYLKQNNQWIEKDKTIIDSSKSYKTIFLE